GDGINTNTSAIGSRVVVTSNNIKQVREVSGGKGCCENDMLPIHIGLGDDEQFDMLIEWTKGEKCTFSNLSVDNAIFYKVSQKNCTLFSY
ncbi:MAG: hypothetical protein GTN99_01335, partial [Candidatus Dadabacteria bacterium]|nr:hypothetical protein [Candidatus Dadabacteria bacterium]